MVKAVHMMPVGLTGGPEAEPGIDIPHLNPQGTTGRTG
jgi:hypothetical protein